MTAVTTNDEADSLQSEPSVAPPRKGIRLRVPTAIAALAAIALVGAGAGAQLKGRASASSAGTGTAATPSGPNGNGVPGNGVPGRFTTGTVTSVDGSTIHLTDAKGAAVTVTVPGTATITTREAGALSDLAVGSFISVTGATGTDGTTTAGAVMLGDAPPAGAGNGPPPAGQ